MAEPYVDASKPPKAGKGMVKSRLLAMGISFLIPGIGLALYSPERRLEGIIAFIIGASLDLLAVLFFFGMMTVAPIVCGMFAFFLFPFSTAGIFMIPVVHVVASIHTYVRSS